MKRILGIAAVVALAGCATAPRHSPEVVGALGPFVDRGEIAGVVSVLSDDDYNLTVDTFGWADVENRVPMSTDTLFAVFSMTKTFTGCALMVAIDQGLLKPDDYVSKYLPEFKDVANPITIHDCMCHIAGIDGGDTEMVHCPDTVREQARTFATKGKAVRPIGEKFRYGNASVNTAAACLVVAARMPYEVFLQKYVLDPLGMKDTTFAPSEAQLKRLVKAYTTAGGPFKPAADHCNGQLQFPSANPIYPMPAAGLYSTPADMVRFSGQTKVSVNLQPCPGEVSREMSAPLTRAISLTIARPSPDPPVSDAREASARQNRSKTCFLSSEVSPMPWSSTLRQFDLTDTMMSGDRL